METLLLDTVHNVIEKLWQKVKFICGLASWQSRINQKSWLRQCL